MAAEPWSDAAYRILTGSGLGLLVLGAVSSGLFAWQGVRWALWPLALALLVVSLGSLLVMALDGMLKNAKHGMIAGSFALCIALSLWHLLSRGAPWSGPPVVLGAVLVGGFLALILAFLVFFRMDRLW